MQNARPAFMTVNLSNCKRERVDKTYQRKRGDANKLSSKCSVFKESKRSFSKEKHIINLISLRRLKLSEAFPFSLLDYQFKNTQQGNYFARKQRHKFVMIVFLLFCFPFHSDSWIVISFVQFVCLHSISYLLHNSLWTCHAKQRFQLYSSDKLKSSVTRVSSSLRREIQINLWSQS